MQMALAAVPGVTINHPVAGSRQDSLLSPIVDNSTPDPDFGPELLTTIGSQDVNSISHLDRQPLCPSVRR